MADNPYAEFQQQDNDEQKKQAKPAAAAPSANAGSDPYAEFQTDEGTQQKEAPKEEKPGVVSKAWTAINTPTYNYNKREQDAYMRAKNYATSAPTKEDSEHPIWSGIKKGAAGMYADTADTLRSFTSPLGMAALAAEPVAGAAAPMVRLSEEAPLVESASGPVVRGVGSMVSKGAKAAGLMFGGQGAKEAYEGGKDIAENGVTAENASRVVGGTGQALLGAAPMLHGATPEGVKEKLTAPVRVGAKIINAAKDNPEITGAVAGAGLGASHGPVGVGVGAVEGARGGGMVNRFLKKLPRANEQFGMRPTAESKNLVGNEYIPPETKAQPVPPAKPGKPRIEYGGATEHVPAKDEPNLVGNEHTEGTAPQHEAPVTPKGALGRIEYAQPTPKAEPTAEGLVGNEHVEGAPTEKTPAPTTGKARIEYGNPTKSIPPKEEGLTGSDYTEGQMVPKGGPTPKNPIAGVEYGEHQPAAKTPDKDITREMVKSSPGTSMAGDAAHVEKARTELGDNAPTDKVLARAEALKDEAAANHEIEQQAKEKSNKEATDAQMEAHEANGGSTFSPEGKNLMGEDKYSVGQYPKRTATFGADFTDHDLAQFKKDNADLLQQPDHAVGTWTDPDTGKHVLDVVKLYGDKDEAIAAGKAANQKGIFGLKNGDYIETGGTGEGTVDEAKAQAGAEAPKTNEGATEKTNTGAEPKVSPEDVTSVNNIVKDLGEQDIIKAGKKYDVDHENYDFKKRDEGRHRVERDQYAKDLTAEIPDEMKQKLLAAEKAFDDTDNSTFTDAERSNDSRAQRAKAIWDKAHESDFEAQMKAKGPAPEATSATAKMSDAELLKHGFTKEDIEAGKHLPEVGGGGEGKSAAAEKGIPEALAKHMTPEEIASVTKTPKATQKFVENMSKIPSVQEYTDIALAGEGARKWYQRSSAAFDAMKEEAPKYFDQPGDKEKFTGLLASSSPRQSVAMNMRETLGAWKAYVDAGRPEGEALKSLLRENFTLPNTKIPNAMKALAGEKMWPDLTKNNAFKAPSFERNLRGWLDYSTNDGWMALFGDTDPKALQNATSYHPLSVATRAAAKALGWETAEAQAAIWSFTQALTERGEELPEEIRRQSEDFADILAHDPQTRQLVSDLGVNLDQLDTRLKAIGEKPEVTGRTTGTTSRSIGKLKGRIEEARGKGTIPPSKSAQGELGFREPHPVKAKAEAADEETSFEPEKLEKEESEAIPLRKLYDRSAVLISPDGKLMSIPEYDPRSESPQHPELLRKSGYKGDMTKFLKEGGVRAFTTGPEEAGVEIQNDSPETIKRALKVVDGLDREKTRFEIADPKTFRTTFSASGNYRQIKAALDNRK